jgi:hypothetical protein
MKIYFAGIAGKSHLKRELRWLDFFKKRLLSFCNIIDADYKKNLSLVYFERNK